MVNSKYIGERIAYFLKEKGISQQKLIALLQEKSGQKYVQGTISNWKNGLTSAPIELTPVFCDIFEVSYDEFFGTDRKSLKSAVQIKVLLREANGDANIALEALKEKYDNLVIELKKCGQEKKELDKKLEYVYKMMKKFSL